MAMLNIEERRTKRKTVQIKQKRHKTTMEQNIEENSKRELPRREERKNECDICKKILKEMTKHECRCGNVFCANFVPSIDLRMSTGVCLINYRGQAHQKLKRDNPVIAKRKLSK
jgi:hypothetical protein